jgi:hypothetical protein
MSPAGSTVKTAFKPSFGSPASSRRRKRNNAVEITIELFFAQMGQVMAKWTSGFNHPPSLS